MKKEDLLFNLSALMTDLQEAREYAKSKKLPVAMQSRLRAMSQAVASMHYRVDNAAPEPLWDRLKAFVKGLA